MALDANKIVLLRKQELKVFLVAGQSNVLRGDPILTADEDVVSELYQPVYTLNAGEFFQETGESLNHPIVDLTKIGFAVEFGRLYLADNQTHTILLVPAGLGTTGFATPGAWLANTGTSYIEAINRAFVVMEGFPNAEFLGMLWLQGEFDANLSVAEVTYAAQLDAMIAAMRTDIPRASQSAFLLGQMFAGLVASEPNRQPVQDAITDTPNRVTNSLAALATGLTSYDNLHYDRASMLTLGQRYYDNYNLLL